MMTYGCSVTEFEVKIFQHYFIYLGFCPAVVAIQPNIYNFLQSEKLTTVFSRRNKQFNFSIERFGWRTARRDSMLNHQNLLFFIILALISKFSRRTHYIY